ncbi:MAG TPA: M23 family metallopeptidase [Gemmatimonadaceae bacterium]|jgi:hypothetical protein|nr:M23 family metallopeptidase [Gemmatimonadaceae bacterium]
MHEHRRIAGSLLLLAATACGGASVSDAGHDEVAPVRPVPWVAGAVTQPVPAWGSPVRLNLPVALSDIVLGVGGGLGAFGAHEGGHVEGLNHVWIPTRPGIPVRSWAAGTVTRIEDMGARGTPDGRHEYFITIDYGRGLVGKHLDVDLPMVKVGDAVKEGDPVGAMSGSAEFNLIDNNRTDGERTGGITGAPVSPFDYLRDDVKAALLARYQAEVVPDFARGATSGNARPWEPYLTNPMLYHADHRGTIVGEWILVNKSWSNPDPVYYDVMAIFDVTNPYGHFQRIEAMDHDWSNPGHKVVSSGTWTTGDGAGRLMLTLDHSAPWYALYTVDESGGRAKLTMEWKQGGYPAAITSTAAVYAERSAIYLGGDAAALGLGR